MNTRKAVGIGGIILAAVGLAGIVYSALSGDLSINLILIIPVISIRGPIGVLCGMVFIVGVVMMILSTFLKGTGFQPKGINRENRGINEQTVQLKNDWGGVVFLGPFPIVFGNRSFREKLPGWLILIGIGVITFILLQVVAMILIFII